ncbi:MAG: class C sortase [Clostridiales bacterium]|jgi:sortase A|nr:class C sortase [Clostridiales bacterium]
MAAKKKAPVILFLLMSVIGTGIMLYPAVSEQVNSKYQTRAIAAYLSDIYETSSEKLEEVMADAARFNELLQKLNVRYSDSDLKDVYKKTLRLDASDVIAYIEIPKIDVYLPIFHGTDKAVLQAGVGHLEGTSLPVGGENTHAALSGHRGLPSAKLFTNLDKLQNGDVFIVRVLNKSLYYEVDQIDVVLPEQVDKLAVEPGRDLMTLITCTPYAVNTHRLLVRGTRITDMELPEESIPLGAPEELYDWRNEPFKLPLQSQILLASAALAFVIKIILELRRKRLRDDYPQQSPKPDIRRSRLA